MSDDEMTYKERCRRVLDEIARQPLTFEEFLKAGDEAFQRIEAAEAEARAQRGEGEGARPTGSADISSEP